MTLKLYCICGDWLKASAHPGSAASAIGTLWAALHGGEGHAPTDARGAVPGAMGHAGRAMAHRFAERRAAAIARGGVAQDRHKEGQE